MESLVRITAGGIPKSLMVCPLSSPCYRQRCSSRLALKAGLLRIFQIIISSESLTGGVILVTLQCKEGLENEDLESK